MQAEYKKYCIIKSFNGSYKLIAVNTQCRLMNLSKYNLDRCSQCIGANAGNHAEVLAARNATMDRSTGQHLQ